VRRWRNEGIEVGIDEETIIVHSFEYALTLFVDSDQDCVVYVPCIHDMP